MFKPVNFLFFIFFAMISSVFAREEMNINWQSNNQFSFDGAIYKNASPDIPVFLKIFPVANSYGNIEVSDFRYEVIPNARDLDIENISAEFQVKKTILEDRKQYKVALEIFPLRYRNGVLEKLVGFSYELTNTGSPSSSRRKGKTYKSSSVLSSGDWYKVGVNSAGLYKIDASVIESLGLNPSSVSPSQTHIYGQRGGMLPMSTGDASITDDLEPLSIKLIDDGRPGYQDNDAIVFYAEGPEAWTYDSIKSKTFIHENHDYSDFKGYFITFGSQAQNLVKNAAPITANADYKETSFIDLQFVEDDLENLNKSGRTWLGDEFGIEASRQYSFSFPDRTNADIDLHTNLVARSTFASSQFTLTANGNQVDVVNINKVSSQYTADVARKVVDQYSATVNGDNITFDLSYLRQDFEAKGWLDFLALNVERNLIFRSSPLYINNYIHDSRNATVSYEFTDVSGNVEVWNVHNIFSVERLGLENSGGKKVAKVKNQWHNKLVAFSAVNERPFFIEKIPNQNLHAIPQVDFLIVTRPAFLSQANELAQLHQDRQNLSYAVVTLEEIYNEFSSGNADVTAIRNFVQMFYDRAGSDESKLPKYLLLFGDGNYDYKNISPTQIPPYQSKETLRTIETYVTDDYFGLLGGDSNSPEGEGVDNGNESIDIAIGRIPADDVTNATIAVQKIRNYMDSRSFGDWRNQLTFIADDEDGNIHINDCDGFTKDIAADFPVYNIDKIYLDAYKQVSTAGGSLYPEVNKGITRKMFTGSFIMNYVGHGGTNGLAHERVVTFEDIAQWENEYKLPLWMTATCEFTRYDNPGQFSAGERLFFKEDGGAIALVTTVRLVFSNRNKTINENVLSYLFDPLNGPDMTLGEIIRQAKNITFEGTGNRKFSLIGDPALLLAYPENRVYTTRINGNAVSAIDSIPTDTLRALSRDTIEGIVTDRMGNVLNDFNGELAVKIYDKAQNVTTLRNEETSFTKTFSLQKNVIFNGKVSVTEGKFKFDFIVPKDINYSYGRGKISYYAFDGDIDAAGFDNSFVIGGDDDGSNINDDEGPEIAIFLDNENFFSGGITSEKPLLLANLSDESGINTSGNGIGHDITAIIDAETNNTIVLNDFYEGALDDFTRGKVKFPMDELSTGNHTLRLKAWDVLNNSSEAEIQFVVAESAELALKNVINYPNPFTTQTSFIFEHNRPGEVLEISVEVYTIAGKLIKSIEEIKVSDGFRVNDIRWDGLDDFGDKIGRGVYLYKLSVSDGRGGRSEELQKLVLLR